MTAKGYIKLYRAIRDNPLWKETHSYGSAWVDLLLRARHTPGHAIMGAKSVWQEAGELFYSERKLAESWGWSRGKVRRYLELLESLGMVRRRSADGTTDGTTPGPRWSVLTIRKWDQYQYHQRDHSSDDGAETYDEPRPTRGTSNGTTNGPPTVPPTGLQAVPPTGPPADRIKKEENALRKKKENQSPPKAPPGEPAGGGGEDASREAFKRAAELWESISEGIISSYQGERLHQLIADYGPDRAIRALEIAGDAGATNLSYVEQVARNGAVRKKGGYTPAAESSERHPPGHPAHGRRPGESWNHEGVEYFLDKRGQCMKNAGEQWERV